MPRLSSTRTTGARPPSSSAAPPVGADLAQSPSPAVRGGLLLPALTTVGALGLVSALLVSYRRQIVVDLKHAEGVGAAHRWVSEGGPLEGAQLVVLALLATLGALLLRRGTALGWIVLLGSLTVLTREADWILESTFGAHAHRPAMVALLGVLALAAWGRRRTLGAEVARAEGAVFALVACAALLQIAGQIMGHREIWELLAPEAEAARVAKRFVEEGLETLSYLLALAAALLLWLRRPTASQG